MQTKKSFGRVRSSHRKERWGRPRVESNKVGQVKDSAVNHHPEIVTSVVARHLFECVDRRRTVRRHERIQGLVRGFVVY